MPGYEGVSSIVPNAVDRAIHAARQGCQLGVLGETQWPDGFPGICFPAGKAPAASEVDTPNLTRRVLRRFADLRWFHLPGLSGKARGKTNDAKQQALQGAHGDASRGVDFTSPSVMRRVGDNLFGIGSHLDSKLHGLAVGFEIGGGFLGNLPVQGAIEVFDHANLYGFLFVVAQFYFERLIQPAITHVDPIVLSTPFPFDVEGAAGEGTDGFIARRMLDLILSREFQLAVCVLPVESQAARRQGHPQVIGLGVVEFPHHPHLRIRLRSVFAVLSNAFHAPTLVLALVDLYPVVNVKPLRLDSGSAHELHLLGFLIVERGWAVQLVEMVFFKRLFGNLRNAAGYSSDRPPGSETWPIKRTLLRLNLADVPGHQFDPGVLEGLTCPIVDGHPANHLKHVAFLGRDQVVIGFPVHSPGHVAELGVHAAGLVSFENPVERGLKDRVVRKRGEERLAGKPKAQLAADLDDGFLNGLRVALPRVIGIAIRGEWLRWRDVPAADDLALNNFRLVALLHEEVEGLALIQREKQLLGYGIRTVILLEDLQGPHARGVSQNHGVWLQIRRRVGELYAVHSRLQV